MWFHFSPCDFPEGALLESPDARGERPISWGEGEKLEQASAWTHFLSNRVFIYHHSSDDPGQHFGLGPWATRDRHIYEVQPLDEPQPDPSPADDNLFHCHQATIIRCIYRPE